MKKVILSGLLVTAVLVGFICFFQNKSPKIVDETMAKRVVLDGKTDGADSLADLEEKSAIIIKGTKLEEIGIEKYKSSIGNSFVGGHTNSDFKITEVYKNSGNNSKIKVNNNITILENSIYDKKSGTIYCVNGYEKMKNNKDYLLFLYPENKDGLFVPYGVSFGKVSLENEGESKGRDDDTGTDIVEKIANEAREKYLNLKGNE